jgi:cell pole-organizing protein PopZ
MAHAAKSQEPSMEDILASIRRIIAEDDTEKSAQHPAQAAGVELNSDVAASSLGASRAMGDSYSAAPAIPLESASAVSDFSDGAATVNRSPMVLDLTEPTTSRTPRSAASVFDPSLPLKAAAIEPAIANDAVIETGTTRDHEGGGLMSSATSAAVDSAFNALAQTVLVQNARTLEDLVREMLRPMLKVWLDNNLPGMVERLVRGEIERVSRGRSG